MHKPMTDEERLKELKRQRAWLKHGPSGSGERGACDPGCFKCGVDKDIKELEAKMMAAATAASKPG